MDGCTCEIGAWGMGKCDFCQIEATDMTWHVPPPTPKTTRSSPLLPIFNTHNTSSSSSDIGMSSGDLMVEDDEEGSEMIEESKFEMPTLNLHQAQHIRFDPFFLS